MTAVCNSCGSQTDAAPCQHCPTLLCSSCRVNHESVCEPNQKRKSRGQGATVSSIKYLHRPGHETPDDVRPQTIDHKTTAASLKESTAPLEGSPSTVDLDAVSAEDGWRSVDHTLEDVATVLQLSLPKIQLSPLDTIFNSMMATEIAQEIAFQGASQIDEQHPVVEQTQNRPEEKK